MEEQVFKFDLCLIKTCSLLSKIIIYIFFFLSLGEAETQVAFDKHFNEEMSVYGPICIVNLIDQQGKEKVIGDAYTNHIFNFNSPNLAYALFDFHEYW